MNLSRRYLRCLTALFALAVAAALLPAAASAAYEQVGNFGPLATPIAPEEDQLGGTTGLAVNYTGAGGVPAGTIYASNNNPKVVRYNPDGTFAEAWSPGTPERQIRLEGGGTRVIPEQLPERCGPDGEPSHPTCPPFGSGDGRDNDVVVDQQTGYVYEVSYFRPGVPLITVYSADGSEVITRFGQAAGYEEEYEENGNISIRPVYNDNTDETPANIHGDDEGMLALNESNGDVYVFDKGQNAANVEFLRDMVFEPATPGDYSHYVYAGRSHDIWAANPSENKFPGFPRHPATDAAGHLYISSEQYIAKLDPSDPSGPPLCELKYRKGGIEPIAVNPVTEEVFFATAFKDSKIHQLKAECGADGQFVEAGSFAFSPKRNFVTALAVDPDRSGGPGRPDGLLYAASFENQGYIFAAPHELPPAISSETVSHITASTALLHAQINPEGTATRYKFEYLTQGAYEESGDSFAGASEAPVGGAPLGEGNQSLSAAAAITSLEADTSYRVRVAAASFCKPEEPEVPCESAGPSRLFHTYPVEPPGLPDHRAYELVSPIQKHGGQVFPANPERGSCEVSECKPGAGSQYPRSPYVTSSDGDSIAYRGSAFSFTEGALGENEYVARRTSSGWRTDSPTPGLFIQGSTGGAYASFDPGLDNATLVQGRTGPTLSASAPSGFQNIYSQSIASPFAVTPLITEAPQNRDAETFQVRYVGSSEDLSHIFFEANDALTEATANAPKASDGGLNENDLYEWSAGTLKLVNVDPGNATAEPGAGFPGPTAISTDGTRAFWVGADGQIYLREDAQRTVEVSASQRAVEDPVHSPPTFLAASADGSRVLFSSSQELTEDASPGTDLYLWNEGALSDLSAGNDPGEFRRLVGTSEDLSHVYFIDGARLDEAANERGEVATLHADNLYSYQEGNTRLVAVPAKVSPGGTTVREATTSADGHWLAFSAEDPLTGFDNNGPCERNGEVRISHCPEIFLYDSATGALTCPSCNPSGASPLGSSFIPQVNTHVPQRPLHFLTDSGRLYFDSQDSLVPADTNEGAEDVYEYEPDGEGTCERGAGCVSLISAGRNDADSNLAAIDASGKNVFFTTWDQLALKDEDDLMDLYDAREGGGIAAESEPARPKCQGEGCLPVSSAPNDPTPGSSTFNGAGNVKEGPKHAKHHKKKQKRHHHRASGQTRRAHR
jgi:hypothetical protein